MARQLLESGGNGPRRVGSRVFRYGRLVRLWRVLAVSYLIHPLEVPRYVLISFVGMFAMASLGAASIRSVVMLILLAALLVNFSVAPVHDRVRHPETPGAALRYSPLGEFSWTDKVAVFPPYCVNVVRFYLPPERRDAPIGMGINAIRRRC